MKVINLGEKNSLLNKFVAQMRDKGIQKDSQRFRRNLERLGEIFAYEISQTLNYSEKQFVTPLGIANIGTPDDQIVVSTILRAGLPLHQGILNFFDGAQNAFVAAYRKYDKGEDFHINIEYASTPDLTGKTLILADTMLATGASLEIAYNRLCEEGEPAHTHLVCPIACNDGTLEWVAPKLTQHVLHLWSDEVLFQGWFALHLNVCPLSHPLAIDRYPVTPLVTPVILAVAFPLLAE